MLPREHNIQRITQARAMGVHTRLILKLLLRTQAIWQGYSSSSAATFRKQNPCFFLPFSPACATRTSILPAGKQFCYVVHLQCRDAEKQHLFCSLSSLHTTSNLQCFRKIEGLIQKDANSVISTCKRPPCGHFQISGLSSFTYTHLL